MTPFHDESLRCRLAQQRWQQRSVRERCQFLKCVRHLLVERSNSLCRAVADDVLRDPGEVIGTDLLAAAANAKYLQKSAPRILAPRRANGSPVWLLDTSDRIHRRPRGIVGVIGTWNYPIFLTLGAILPALVAGNGVLWKPSELAPRTADELDKLFMDAGVERDLVVKLPATREAGPQLCDADIDFLHFTGSDSVGRKIAARLGERLIPSTLELSGNDAFVVMANADLNLAVRSAWYGATLNNGQTCMCARRAFVARPLFESFVNLISALVEESRPLPLVTAGQVEQFDGIVNEARASGVRVLSSSTPATRPGVTPAVIVDPPASFSSCTEAVFAPLLSVLPFDSDADLIDKVTASPFGLSSAIFAGDTDAAKTLAEKIRAGSVVVNDVIVPAAHPGTPFGGRGASGWGTTQGEDGLLDMTVPQAVSVRRGRFRPHVDAAIANDPAAAEIMQGVGSPGTELEFAL